MQTTINNAPMFWKELGSPETLPVVFVHGFPFSHWMWLNQMEAVSDEFRAIAYDVRGHGESFIGDGQYTLEGHVDDLLALLDHLKLREVIIVGLSMGGYIALRALEREPARFLGAVLCDTRSEADSNEGKLKRHSHITLVKRDGSAAFAGQFIPALFASESFSTRTGAVQMVREMISRTPPLSIAGTLLALAGRTDTTASLSSIRIPVLILVGESDKVTPRSAAETMHKQIAGSELHIIPNAGHMSNLENPLFFNEKLLAFLSRAFGRRK